MLYIWPVVDFSVDEMRDIARRLAPLTEGLGLEQVVVSGRLLVPGSDQPGRRRAPPRLRGRPRA